MVGFRGGGEGTVPLEREKKNKNKSDNVRWIMGGREHRKRKLKIRTPQCRQVHPWSEVTHRPMLRTMVRVR
jgi:hypothetical protein